MLYLPRHCSLGAERICLVSISRLCSYGDRILQFHQHRGVVRAVAGDRRGGEAWQFHMGQ